MSNLARGPNGALFDPISGRRAGFSDLNGDEQLLSSASAGKHTIVTAGDSLTAQGYILTGSTFLNRASEGAFNWCDAFLGGPFRVLGNYAVGGKTALQVSTEQLAVVLALRGTSKPRWVWLTEGTNDPILDALVLAASTDDAAKMVAARKIANVEAARAAGVDPIWSTIWAKSNDAFGTPVYVKANDILRRYARDNECGIFWDGERITKDATLANNSARAPLASYFWDSTTHPNNLDAFYIGQYAAAAIAPKLFLQNFSIVGNEDLTLSGAKANLLLNPSFIGTAGTAGTGVTGSVPTNWTVDWATRTGTGSAACAVVAVNDPTTGLQVAQAIQLTLSGTASNNDVLRITQSQVENPGLASNLSTGDVVQGEATVSVASGANVREIAMRVQTNGTESTWWGSNGQTAVDYPATVPAAVMRTIPMSVLGSGVASAARHDLRVKFSGSGAGTVITYILPRTRKFV